MNTNENILEKAITLTDSLAELKFLLERISILSDDVCGNYIEHIDFKTERGKLTAEYDFNIVKTMTGVIHNYISEASEAVRNMPDVSNEIVEALKEKTTF